MKRKSCEIKIIDAETLCTCLSIFSRRFRCRMKKGVINLKETAATFSFTIHYGFKI